MFCRIYITRENLNRGELLFLICNLLNANLINNSYIEKEGYSIEVRPNDEFDKNKGRVFPDGFLYFPLNIEIDIQDNIEIVNAAEVVGTILKVLWKNEYTAIASCDFEDILPEKGGYKSKNVPWIG